MYFWYNLSALRNRNHIIDIQYSIKISGGFILEFVEIKTVGHLLMFWFRRGNRDIVVKISDSKKNSYMEFQSFTIFHISDTEIKLC